MKINKFHNKEVGQGGGFDNDKEENRFLHEINY